METTTPGRKRGGQEAKSLLGIAAEMRGATVNS